MYCVFASWRLCVDPPAGFDGGLGLRPGGGISTQWRGDAKAQKYICIATLRLCVFALNPRTPGCGGILLMELPPFDILRTRRRERQGRRGRRDGQPQRSSPFALRATGDRQRTQRPGLIFPSKRGSAVMETFGAGTEHEMVTNPHMHQLVLTFMAPNALKAEWPCTKVGSRARPPTSI